MQVIAKASFLFVRDPLGPARKEITVHPSGNIQTVPDWIEEDPLFGMAVADGNLIEVKVISPPPEKKEPAATGAMTAGKGLEGSTPATREDIEAMTKNEMITFALEKYQLKLNPQSSKGDMVDTIVDVMTKP